MTSLPRSCLRRQFSLKLLTVISLLSSARLHHAMRKRVNKLTNERVNDAVILFCEHVSAAVVCLSLRQTRSNRPVLSHVKSVLIYRRDEIQFQPVINYRRVDVRRCGGAGPTWRPTWALPVQRPTDRRGGQMDAARFSASIVNETSPPPPGPPASRAHYRCSQIRNELSASPNSLLISRRRARLIRPARPGQVRSTRSASSGGVASEKSWTSCASLT